MVSPEIRAVKPTDSSRPFMLKAWCRRVTMTAAVVPLTMPQISPTTSLQKLLTWLALRSSDSASAAPFSLCAAMEWNGRSSAAVTATPTTSNPMPNRINTASTSTASRIPAPSNAVSDRRLRAAERATDMKKTRKIH